MCGETELINLFPGKNPILLNRKDNFLTGNITKYLSFYSASFQFVCFCSGQSVHECVRFNRSHASMAPEHL